LMTNKVRLKIFRSSRGGVATSSTGATPAGPPGACGMLRRRHTGATGRMSAECTSGGGGGHVA
jgi:hypothetical protein